MGSKRLPEVGCLLPPGNFTFTQGIHKLLLMPVLFADDPVVPVSQDSLQATGYAVGRDSR